MGRGELPKQVAWRVMRQGRGGVGDICLSGLMPVPLPRACQARTAGMACQDRMVKRWVLGQWPGRVEGVCGAFSLLGLSTPSPLNLPQGEAGRNGAPGEKGPSGLPVSAWGSHGAGAAVDAPTQGVSWGPWLGLVQGSLRKGAPQPLGFPTSGHVLPGGLGSSDS